MAGHGSPRKVPTPPPVLPKLAEKEIRRQKYERALLMSGIITDKNDPRIDGFIILLDSLELR